MGATAGATGAAGVTGARALAACNLALARSYTVGSENLAGSPPGKSIWTLPFSSTRRSIATPLLVV
jgi:hypothetical protein